ncbi:hypothetical protein M8J76_009536 [Diaphorina citri]|nr:hypothetical protein M8J76_009536 [Diaphorina citri]
MEAISTCKTDITLGNFSAYTNETDFRGGSGSSMMWSSVASSSESECPSARSKHSATLLGGDIYLLGGRNGNLPLKDFWRYSLSENKWEQLHPSGDNPPCLQEHTAVVHKDCIYVFGGENNQWRKFCSQRGANVPRGRRGHSALLYRGAMLIYGGYRDLKGSSNELWAFHFDTESWHLLSCGKNCPPARHKHSAITHGDAMWIYGGMTDLHDRADLWRFDLQSKRWTPIKCKVSPGSLHSHAACKLPSSMLLFGGERGGHPNNELWRFHFGSLLWEKVSTDGVKPHPRSESVALTLSELLFSQNSNKYERTQSHDYQNNILPLTQNNINILDKNHRSNFDMKRKTATTPNSCNLNILKEISKLSQKNLPLLSQNRCSYIALNSNGSNESVNNSDIDESPCMKRELVPSKRSQSTNMISRTPLSPTTPMTNKDFTMSFQMTRDNSSVPNFNCSSLLTPVEVTKLVYLDGEEAPVMHKVEDFSSIHQRFHPNNTKMNRRSYPSSGSASVRFGNPITTPEETSDYASLETVHNQNDKLKSQRTDSVKSFSNPNYMGPDVQSILSKQKDYNKTLNSPADSVLEDRIGRATSRPDYLEMKPIPPRSLSLAPSTNCYSKQEAVRKRNNRCSSAGRYEERYEKPPITKLCVFLIGGKEQGQVTVFRRPLSIWKLSLPRHIH